MLRRCIRERLVGGEGFAVDASLIKADANRQKGIEGEKAGHRRPMSPYRGENSGCGKDVLGELDSQSRN